MIIVNESKVECWFTLKFLLMLLLLFFLSLLLLCSVLVPCVVFSFFSSLHFLVCFFLSLLLQHALLLLYVCYVYNFFCVLYTVNYGHFLLHFYFLSPRSLLRRYLTLHTLSLSLSTIIYFCYLCQYSSYYLFCFSLFFLSK